jgi:O-acetylserine/cysteine efflux transporter
MHSRLTPVDVLLGVATALVWGAGILFAKSALGYFPPILLMAFRFLVTSLLLVWFVPIPRGQLMQLARIAFVSAAIQYSLTFTGLAGLDASVTLLVVQLEVPFLVLIGAVALHESPGLRKWLGIALAFVGVALIAGEPRVAAAWGSVLLVIGGAFVWAVGQAMVRQLQGLSGLTTTAWVAVMATPQLFLMSAIFETGQITAIQFAPLSVWITVAYLGVVMNGVGYVMWYTLIHRNPVSQVAPFLLLLPVFGVIGGWLVLGETLTPTILLGGVIVIGGVAFILFERKSGSPKTSG